MSVLGGRDAGGSVGMQEGLGRVRYFDHNFFVASRILFGLDKSVNPCDDFYQYACGGWEAKTAIPGYRGSVSQFSQMREAISMQLRGMYDTSDIYMLIGQPNFSAELHVM